MAISKQFSNPQETNEISRRDLLRIGGIAAGGTMPLGLPRFSGRWLTQAETAQAGNPISVGQRAFLVVDNGTTNVTSVSGGNQFADVLLEPAGPDRIQRKLPGPLKVEDLVVELPLDAPSQALNGWITDMLTKGPVFKNGSIVYADYDFNVVKQLDFMNALITEIALPACDASTKNLVTLKLRITPESTRLVGGKGKLSLPVKSPSSKLTTANFRLSVQGLETASPGITRVEPIVARRQVQQESFGVVREKQLAPSVLDCSLLSILILEQQATPYYTCFDDFILKRNNGPGKERPGLLKWLNPATQKPVASIQFSNLGIVRYAPEPVQAGVDSIPRVHVDVYCESMTMSLPMLMG